MNTKTRKQLLKIAELTGLFSYIYPVTLVIRNVLFTPGDHVFNMLIYLVTVIGGYLLARLLTNKKKTFLRQFMAYISVIVPVLIVLTMNFHYLGVFKTIRGSLQIIYEVVAISVVYVMSVRCSIKAQEYDTFSRTRISAGFVLMVACQIITFYFGLSRQVWYQVTVYTSIYVFCALIVLNQSNLDYNIYVNRGVDSYGEQRKLRSYNIKTTLILVGITLLLFNLKNIVMFLFDVCGIIFYNIIRFFMWLGSLLPIGDTSGGSQPQSDPDMPLLPNQEGNTILDYIFIAIFILLFLFLMYKFIPSLMRKLKHLLKLISARLKIFFNNLFDLNVDHDNDNTTHEFTDKIEFIKPEDNSKSYKKTLSIKNKSGRAKDTTKRIRDLYSAIVDRLSIKLFEVKPSYTTKEILEKASSVEITDESLKIVTDIYEDVRYGMKTPSTNDLATMEKHYKMINKSLR